jgi:hypothetical protein
MAEQHYFPNNRINLDRGFSVLFQGVSGNTVFVRYCRLSGSTVGPLRSGISPSFVLSEAKDIIDILLPGPASGGGEGACFLTIGGVTGSAVNGFWWP